MIGFKNCRTNYYRTEKKKEIKLTLNRRSLTDHTRLAKSFDDPRIRLPVVSKSTDITLALEPTKIPLLS